MIGLVLLSLPVLIGAIAAVRDPAARSAALVLFLVVAAMYATALAIWLRSVVDVVADGEGLVVRRRQGSQRRLPLIDVAEVLDVSALFVPRAGSVRRVFLLGADGMVLLDLSGRSFERDDLGRLVDRFDPGRVKAIVELVTAGQLGRRRSGLVSWPERHPVLSGIVGGFGLVAVLLIGAAIFGG